MSQRIQIDIIGGGPAGLSSAWYISQHPALRGRVAIRVWEAEPTLGGLAGNFEVDGVALEKFYHHIYRSDTDLQTLLAELNLVNDLLWAPASTGAYYYRQPWRLSSPIDLLRYQPLPFWDRLRMGWLVLQARRVRNWQALDEISAKDYLLRHAGRRVYDTVWAPLLAGKFGKYADTVSAAWLWSKLVDRGGSRGKSGREELGYLRGGFGRIWEEIATRLRAEGHTVVTGSPVQALQVSSDGHISHLITPLGTLPTNYVIAAVHTPILADLLPAGFEAYQASLRQVQYLGVVCLTLFLRRSLSAFYWTNPTRADAPFVGLVEQTNWVAPSEYGGQHLVYLSAYLPTSDPRYMMDASTYFQHLLPYLLEMFPDFSTDAVLRYSLWRAPYAQPVVQVGYARQLPAPQTPIHNLVLATMAQIYPKDRQVSNAIQQGKNTAKWVCKLMLDTQK